MCILLLILEFRGCTCVIIGAKHQHRGPYTPTHAFLQVIKKSILLRFEDATAEKTKTALFGLVHLRQQHVYAAAVTAKTKQEKCMQFG